MRERAAGLREVSAVGEIGPGLCWLVRVIRSGEQWVRAEVERRAAPGPRRAFAGEGGWRFAADGKFGWFRIFPQNLSY